VSLEKALAILGDLLELKRVALRVEPQDPYLGQALKIAVENRVTVYDSLFIAQAIAKKQPSPPPMRDRVGLQRGLT